MNRRLPIAENFQPALKALKLNRVVRLGVFANDLHLGKEEVQVEDVEDVEDEQARLYNVLIF